MNELRRLRSLLKSNLVWFDWKAAAERTMASGIEPTLPDSAPDRAAVCEALVKSQKNDANDAEAICEACAIGAILSERWQSQVLILQRPPTKLNGNNSLGPKNRASRSPRPSSVSSLLIAAHPVQSDPFQSCYAASAIRAPFQENKRRSLYRRNLAPSVWACSDRCMKPALNEQIDELLIWFETEAPEVANLFRNIRALPGSEQAQCLTRMDDWMAQSGCETRRHGLTILKPKSRTTSGAACKRP